VCPEIGILLIGWIINGKNNPFVILPTLLLVKIEFPLQREVTAIYSKKIIWSRIFNKINIS
jgi:hypothetical protein